MIYCFVIYEEKLQLTSPWAAVIRGLLWKLRSHIRTR